MAKNEKTDETDLDRMALDEILKEAKRGKERAETMGPMGWLKCPLVPTNKRFFRNVLMGTLTNQKKYKGMKDRKHERQNSAMDCESLTSDPPSSPYSSSQDKKIKTNDYNRSLQSYSSLKYPNEAGSSMQKISEDKHKQSTNDHLPDKRFHNHHSSECDEEQKNDHKKSRKDDLADKRSYRNCERYDDEKPHKERNHRKKHRLEEHKKTHKSHKHRKKRKKCKSPFPTNA